MGSVFKRAFLVMLASGAAFSLPAGGVAAQAPRTPSLSQQERDALSALQTALTARNYVAAATALPAAQAAARGNDARYYTAMLQFQLGRDTGNTAMQSAAIDAMLASGLTPAADLPSLYLAQGNIAAATGNRQRAEAALTRAFELAPDAETAISLVRLKLDLRKNQEAIALLDRAVALRRASGQPVPESWFHRGAALATENNLGAQSLKFTRELVAAYPEPENWRDAILVYRDVAKPDQTVLLDVIRLARLSKALAGERDYLEAAQTFDAAGLAGESRSVLDEGVSSRMVDPAKGTFKEAIAAAAKRAAAEKARLSGLQASAMAATSGSAALQAGDLFLGSANYAAAADLFRAAVQKGGADPNVANIRLGIALALAGRRSEADAAFRAVTGPRADLAALWLVWLGQRS